MGALLTAKALEAGELCEIQGRAAMLRIFEALPIMVEKKLEEMKFEEEMTLAREENKNAEG